jgi:hypothetical protein
MKRLLIFPVLLFMVACAPPGETTSPEAIADPATATETYAPARGALFKISDRHGYYIREWQHPRTGCWYLLGTANASGITPLNDANGQICETPSRDIAR